MSEPLVLFARALREEGVEVGTGAVADFVRAAELTEDAYWSGRATLLSRPEQIEVYDRVFAEFFGAADAPRERRPQPVEVGLSRRRGSVASELELFGRLRSAEPGEDPLGLGVRLPLRRSRRRRHARRGEPDLRRTLRQALRTGGDPARFVRKERRLKPRRVILLLDVSGSMSTYVRPLVLLAHAALQANKRWEVFCFATRLTRLTHALADGDPERALRRASSEVVDWEGGTRIGESIKRFLDDYGHSGMARGAVVVICSDGFDVGEADVLGEQMARLSRLAYRVVWLNPLLALPSYEPRAAGMRAALPYVDVFADLARD
jgi:uncharacterized protein with von Willebrand factor type A (vWA) domain